VSENGSNRAPVERKTRRHERRRVELPVTIVEAEQKTAGDLLFDTTDLSIGGAFLRSTVLFEVDEILRIEFDLGGPTIVARARVVRVSYDEPPGMGIEFVGLDDDERDAIKAYLTKP
jgi:hypothetical protein